MALKVHKWVVSRRSPDEANAALFGYAPCLLFDLLDRFAEPVIGSGRIQSLIVKRAASAGRFRDSAYDCVIVVRPNAGRELYQTRRRCRAAVGEQQVARLLYCFSQ